MAPNQQMPEPIVSQTLQDTVQISKKEILYDGVLYDVSNFIHRHPGGDKILVYYTAPGEDATLAIQQFHSRSIDKVLKMMKSLPHRPQPLYELSDEMKKVGKRNAEMTADFVQLYKELKEEGMFEPWFPHWIYRFVEFFALRLLGLSIIMDTTGPLAQFIGCFILMLSFSKAGWMLHEFGHLSASGNTTVDRFMNGVMSGLGMGLSANWWRRHHNKHHAMPNRVSHDPDLDSFPGALLLSEKMLSDSKTRRTWIQRYQVYLLPPLLVALHVQWTYWHSIYSVIRNKSVLEFIFVGSFHYMMYQIGFGCFVITSSLWAFFFFGNAALSHSFVEVAVEPQHWIEYTFLSTIDIEQRPWCDWWMGYLNYQVEHHLFPTMPQFRGPMIKHRVKALAEKHGLPYHHYLYKDAVENTLSNMKSISEFLKSID